MTAVQKVGTTAGLLCVDVARDLSFTFTLAPLIIGILVVCTNQVRMGRRSGDWTLELEV